MIALTLKAGTVLCRRSCGNSFLGEVLAGCLQRLQLGGDEHASPRDVVCAVPDGEVGGVVRFCHQPLARAVPGTDVYWDAAVELWVLRLFVSSENGSKASQWVDSTEHCTEGRCQSSDILTLPTGSLIHPCALCLPSVSSLCGQSELGSG